MGESGHVAQLKVKLRLEFLRTGWAESCKKCV